MVFLRILSNIIYPFIIAYFFSLNLYAAPPDLFQGLPILDLLIDKRVRYAFHLRNNRSTKY